MNFKLSISILSFILLLSCGFELANYDNNFTIANIDTNGENRINYKLKNKILNKTKNNNANSIYITINSKKERLIKEKNISNQITKYEIIIIVDVEFKSMNDSNINGSFSVLKKGDYGSSAKYSDNLNSEKNLINSLVENISEEVIENLVVYFNDL